MSAELDNIQRRADKTAAHHATCRNSYPLDADRDREYLLALVREQQARLDKVRDLVTAAFVGNLYTLPGSYPSRPVEAYDLHAALTKEPTP